jgi:hypothetical protein
VEVQEADMVTRRLARIHGLKGRHGRRLLRRCNAVQAWSTKDEKHHCYP